MENGMKNLMKGMDGIDFAYISSAQKIVCTLCIHHSLIYSRSLYLDHFMIYRSTKDRP